MKKAPLRELEGRRRIVFEDVSPSVDGGRFPVKRAAGEIVRVEADIFSDGHDRIRALILWKPPGGDTWNEGPMEPLDNDRWTGSFEVTVPGAWRFSMLAWVDRFETWRDALRKRLEAGQDLSVDLRIGAALVREAAG
ncbi:MAG TPA: maltotransferase domain-containing protein, partial [Candidatus Saccharimonadales bacterium]|nr:maltotransferase domain-containing protein [Candidatus Saccharimonadales bacterium]